MCDLPALECAFIQQMLVTLVVFGCDECLKISEQRTAGKEVLVWRRYNFN